jgi:acyl carrier protein
MIRTRLPAPGPDDELRDDSLLGPDGLGMDSIAILELLLECEERWGAGLALELLEQRPLTVGKLVERLTR